MDKEDYKRLSKDLENDQSKYLTTINMYEYLSLIKEDPVSLKLALEQLLPPVVLSDYEQYVKADINNPKKAKSTSRSKSKKAKRKRTLKDSDYIDPEFFEEDSSELTLDTDKAHKLKRWADLAALFKETYQNLQSGKVRKSLKKYNNSKKSSWIRDHVKQMRKVKREKKRSADNEDDQHPQEEPNDELEDILEEALIVRDEFIDSQESEDEGVQEKALLTHSLSKSDNLCSSTSDQPLENADCYYLFNEMLNQCYQSEIPDEIGLTQKLSNGLKAFDKWHLEYRSYFRFQKDNLGYSHDLLTSKYEQPRFSKESIEKLIKDGKENKDMIIPVDEEISDLEFIITEYDEWFKSFEKLYHELFKGLEPNTSFIKDSAKYEKADHAVEQIKILPVISENDKVMLIQVWSISWLRRVEEIMNDTRKHPFSEWILIAEEICDLDDNAYLFTTELFASFQNDYNIAVMVTDLLS